MKRFTFAMVFVLALAVAYAISQESSGAQPGMNAAGQQDATRSNGPQDQPAQSASDDALQQQIRQRFDTDPALKNVEIAVINGEVRLTGTVPSKEERNRAKEIAQSVLGVTKVSEEIKVSDDASPAAAVTGSTAIDETRNNTAGSIAGNSDTTSANSSAQTGGVAGSATTTPAPSTQTAPSGGIGAETGTPPAPMGQTSAGSMSGTAGGTSAQSQMSTLQTQVQVAIQNEPTLSGANVQAVVSEDAITLTGTVRDGKARQTAKRIAQSYAGNRRVVDNMTVTGRGGDPTGAAGTSSTTGTTETGSGTTSANPSGKSNPNAATTPNTPEATPDPTTTRDPNSPPRNPKTDGDKSSPR